MRIAAIQMASGSIIKGNLIEAEKLIKDAAQQGADVVVLPENFGMIGIKQEDVFNFREADGEGELQHFLSAQSARHGIVIFGGSIPIACDSNSRYRNTLMVYDRDGSHIGRYDKIHLFDVSVPGSNEQYHESAVIEPGHDVVLVEVEGIKFGLSICYDLRFPELYRRLANKGAEVIVVPSAFTAATGKAHWNTLLKARAIENLCFMVAPAQGGYHVNGRETHGHSMIVDPWGNILDEIESGSGLAIASLDINQQKKTRESFPVLKHRRFFCTPQPS